MTSKSTTSSATTSNSKKLKTAASNSKTPEAMASNSSTSNSKASEVSAPKPSKSEIENALAGRTSRANRAPQRPKNLDFQLEASPRRQQVIGGDLTGVSKKPKYGIFSRYAEVSVANWVAGAIVVLILIAFFWPDGGESIKEIAEKKAQQTPPSIYTESRIDEGNEIENVQEQNFSRDNDIDRATAFRDADELTLKVRELLVGAEAYAANGAYTQPADGNAVSTYKSVLELDPDNVAAKQGLDAINSRFLAAGYELLEKNQRTRAEKVLAKMAIVNDSSEAYEELNTAIENWKFDRQITKLLSRADKALDRQALILPARENALYYFKQVLELDPENAVALKGVKSVADTYVERTNAAVLKGEYQAAAGYLATVSVIDPKHESIPLMENLIAKAEPIAKRAPSETELSADTSNRPDTSKPAATPTVTPTPKATRPARVSANKTPRKEANEQATFDREYLNLGLEAYYKGEYDTAAALLQPLADKGVSRAQFRIGYMYYLGRGFKKNRKEADRIIRAALPSIQKFANQGRTWAQSDLGSLYEDGLVLPRDYSEAVYWYRSAAEKGYPGAQTNLGIMYALGRGVTSSRRTAIEWFQRAAKQGDIVAKRNLESMGFK